VKGADKFFKNFIKFLLGKQYHYLDTNFFNKTALVTLRVTSAREGGHNTKCFYSRTVSVKGKNALHLLFYLFFSVIAKKKKILDRFVFILL
jgi:hypothetical protein